MFPGKAEILITADQAVRGGKTVDLKTTVDEALQNCPSVRQVFVSQRTGAQVPMGKMDLCLEAVSYHNSVSNNFKTYIY